MPFVLSRFAITLLFGLFFYIGYIIMTTHSVPELPPNSLKTWQRADAPYGYPLDLKNHSSPQKFNPRMHLHSPFEMASIPTAPRFSAAMGSQHAAFTYNAQPFMEPNYSRGGKHTGDDLNGIGGQNSDYGDPVYAIANGLVIYSGTPSPGWGKTVILAHRLTDGRILHSMYAHLHEISATLHTAIPRGVQLGSIGNANGRYLAHLHLELQHTDGFSPQPGYAASPLDRINPESTILALQKNTPATALNTSPLDLLQQAATSSKHLPAMDSKSAEQFQKYLQRTNK